MLLSIFFAKWGLESFIIFSFIFLRYGTFIVWGPYVSVLYYWEPTARPLLSWECGKISMHITYYLVFCKVSYLDWRFWGSIVAAACFSGYITFSDIFEVPYFLLSISFAFVRVMLLKRLNRFASFSAKIESILANSPCFGVSYILSFFGIFFVSSICCKA